MKTFKMVHIKKILKKNYSSWSLYLEPLYFRPHLQCCPPAGGNGLGMLVHEPSSSRLVAAWTQAPWALRRGPGGQEASGGQHCRWGRK